LPPPFLFTSDPDPGPIPHAELVWFVDSGHFPYIEEPDAFWRAVAQFLHHSTHLADRRRAPLGADGPISPVKNGGVRSEQADLRPWHRRAIAVRLGRDGAVVSCGLISLWTLPAVAVARPSLVESLEV
jgi:hypothetical protein